MSPGGHDQLSDAAWPGRLAPETCVDGRQGAEPGALASTTAVLDRSLIRRLLSLGFFG